MWIHIICDKKELFQVVQNTKLELTGINGDLGEKFARSSNARWRPLQGFKFGHSRRCLIHEVKQINQN